jgi:hypothetical protein
MNFLSFWILVPPWGWPTGWAEEATYRAKVVGALVRFKISVQVSSLSEDTLDDGAAGQETK